MLLRLLRELERQRTDGKFTLSVVIADNDSNQSARSVVEPFATDAKIAAVYCAEPRKNIALARNMSLAHARGEFVAFVDDDEFPPEDWLLTLLTTCEKFGAGGILGPVRPHFENPPPRWIIKGRFCERPEHPTGHIMPWEECRTGNVLVRKALFDQNPPGFDPQFPNGGEDKDFFMRMTQQGHVFRWCNEAPVFETVPPDRWTRRFMLRRALLRGKNILKHPTGRLRALATSAVAAPIYIVLLLPMLLLGHHRFMQLCVRLCDHVGRLLAFVGINPVSER